MNEFSTAIYCSEWYNIKSISLRKEILFLLLHSQAKISFNAYGLFDLSYETFMQVKVILIDKSD